MSSQENIGGADQDITPIGLGDKLNLNGSTSLVVGVDSYELHNCLGQIRRWNSYTIVNPTGRYGLTHVQAGVVLWSSIEAAMSACRDDLSTLNLEMSGVARISFQGEQGVSTPVASLLWFDMKNGEFDFVAIERFLRIRNNALIGVTLHYYGGRLLRSGHVEVLS